MHDYYNSIHIYVNRFETSVYFELIIYVQFIAIVFVHNVYIHFTLIDDSRFPILACFSLRRSQTRYLKQLPSKIAFIQLTLEISGMEIE